MNKAKYGLLLIFCLFFIRYSDAQNISMEIGAAIGNVTNQKHSLGKGEVHFSILKSYSFGQLGLDFSTGSNFIPGNKSIVGSNLRNAIFC